MTEQEANLICDKIRQVAYDLHVYLGVGYLEKIYENGLAHPPITASQTAPFSPCGSASALRAGRMSRRSLLLPSRCAVAAVPPRRSNA